MLSHDPAIVWAVPGLGEIRADRVGALQQIPSTIETARKAELRHSGASVRKGKSNKAG